MQDDVGRDTLAASFETHRRRLVRVAYRMLGSFAEAEDAVQDAWLRLAAADDEPRDLGAWLTTVVGRLCLDRLRSARVRREVYVGPWLPEPLVAAAEPGPAEQVEVDESVRLALLVVLERLTPEQRVAFVLHDVLGLPFAAVAEALGTTTASARQHASRGRRAVDDGRPPRTVSLAQQQAVVGAFVAAAAGGDLSVLVEVLAPDVVLTSDGGGKVRAALRPVVGADAVARLILGLVVQGASGRDREGVVVTEDTLSGPAGRIAVVPVLVNGELGLVVRLDRTDGSVDASVVVPHVDETGRVAAVDMIRNPDKLGALSSLGALSGGPDPRGRQVAPSSSPVSDAFGES